MNLCMYCDNEKNLMMFLPDCITDEEIMTLGEIVFPDDVNDGFFISPIKPTGCINLSDIHATYPVDSIYPDNIAPPAL